jgi:hypothetical protein
MESARKDSWKTHPMPEQRAVLNFNAEFSKEEFQKISAGVIPEEMEDKWFIYLDENTLNFHRSWTGFCVFQVEFERANEKYRVTRALVNRNPREYRRTDESYDAALVQFLIAHLLLNKNVDFPQEPSQVAPQDATAASQRPWWKWW